MIIIAAMTKDKLIGKGNELPWHIPEDLQNFKNLTKGNTCIMGFATYQSIGKLLPNRHNVILNWEKVDVPDADVCTSIPEAIEKAKSYGKEIFICGGKSIYKQFLGLADTMYISWIKKDYEGDVFFPDWDEHEWEIEKKEAHDAFDFYIYRRKTA
ncbi:MAG: dihydrofolate reductase [Nanoarchaeota archaeon]